MTKKKSKLEDIVEEISIDINVDKKDVRNALKWTFRQISSALILMRKPVMIRGFLKFVLVTKGIKKAVEDYSKYKTKKK